MVKKKEDIVVVKNLKRYFQQGEIIVKALDRVSLTLKQGEFAALVGPFWFRENNPSQLHRGFGLTQFRQTDLRRPGIIRNERKRTIRSEAPQNRIHISGL